MCYSMDDEQEENEKQKVHLKTFNCIFVIGQDIYKKKGCYYLFVHGCIFPTIFFLLLFSQVYMLLISQSSIMQNSVYITAF